MADILPVPESEKRVLENLLRDLNETYPDKVIKNLGRDHKKWDEKVTRLYKNIGYGNRNEFLAAYGFTVEHGKGGRPSADLNTLVEELISRYTGDRCVESIGQLKEENPDIASKLKTIQNKSKDLFGMSFTDLLKEKGILKDEDNEYKEKLDAIIAELIGRYENKAPEKTASALKENNSDIEGINKIGLWIERIYGKKMLEYLVGKGLVQEKEKKPEKTEEEKKAAEFKKLSAEEKLRITTDELKRRIAAGDSKVETIGELTEKYPDLPIKTLNSWVKKCLGKNVTEYLIEEGILMNTREIYLSRIDNNVDLIFEKYRGFLFEESERYKREINNLSKRIEELGGCVINLKQSKGIHRDMSYGNVTFFVVDPDDENIDGNDYENINLPSYRDWCPIPIISIDALDALLDKEVNKRDSDKQAHDEAIQKFQKEGDDEKLKRAVDMFIRCVQKVESEMDKTNDYNCPIVMFSTLKGESVVDPTQFDRASGFLDAISEWMKNNSLNYDFDSTPEEIVSYISQYYYEAAKFGRCWMDGLVGVRCPIGIAVAYLNYASPFADIELEFAHDKWEARGDYSMGKRVCLTLTQYDKKEKIAYNYYYEKDM